MVNKLVVLLVVEDSLYRVGSSEREEIAAVPSKFLPFAWQFCSHLCSELVVLSISLYAPFNELGVEAFVT